MFDAYIRAVEEKGELIFPEDFCRERESDGDDTKKALDEVEAELGPYLYAGNYYNNPVCDDLVEFKDEWFQYYKFSEISDKLRGAKCIISIDPATKDGQENDPTGILITKVDQEGSVYIVQTIAKKMLPNQLIEEVFNLVDIYSPDVVVIETVSAQILWIDLFSYEMKKRKMHFKLEEYNPGTKLTKPAKIRKLIPYYARGQIFHKQGLTELEKQLREFPRNKNDDLIDAEQAQIPYWTGTYTKKNKPLIKYSAEWWDKLRAGNTSQNEDALKHLFREYRKPNSVTLRDPKW